VFGATKRRGRLQEYEDVCGPSIGGQRVERVPHDRQHWGVVGRQCRRTKERRLEAGPAANLGDLRGVSGQDEPVNDA
jgi:hypothetical protein